jgi:hypothetical protein
MLYYLGRTSQVRPSRLCRMHPWLVAERQTGITTKVLVAATRFQNAEQCKIASLWIIIRTMASALPSIAPTSLRGASILLRMTPQ